MDPGGRPQPRDLADELAELRREIELMKAPKGQTEPVVTDQLKAQAGAIPVDVALVTLTLAFFPAMPVAVAIAAVTVVTHIVASFVAAYSARQKVTPTIKL